MKRVIGLRIQELRKERGMTQEKLGKALYVTRRTISAWENGHQTIDSDMLVLLVKFFDVSADELLGLE